MVTPARGPSWADLHSELLVSIAAAGGLSLRDYTSLRGVCAGWRSALVRPCPCLLSLHDTGGRASVFSLPMQRSFHFPQNLSYTDLSYTGVDGRARVVGSGNGRARVVGSGNGRFAVAIDVDYNPWWTAKIFVLDPRAREDVKLLPPPVPSHRHSYGSVRKVVFAPDPDDGTVVAMCDRKRVAYIDTGGTSDIAWKIVDVIAGHAYTSSLVDLAFDTAAGSSGKVYCLDSSGGVRVLCVPRGSQDEPSVTLLFSPVRGSFPRPYDRVSEMTSTKHLFFCHGRLYQVWQNTSSTVRSGSRFTMATDDIFVLRHDPSRQSSCWDVVKDLGGCSVFIGKYSCPAVVRPSTVPGVRGDCVYWIDWQRNPMVCDIATRTSKPCVLPHDACKANCWYTF